MISNCADGSAGGWAGDAGLASRVEHQSKRCALCPRSVIRITQHLKTYLPLIMYASWNFRDTVTVGMDHHIP